MKWTRIVFLIAGLMVACPSPGRAADPPSPPRSWVETLCYPDFYNAGRGVVQRVRRIEAVELASAILSGADVGPGVGWFHPGQSRYDWKWLAARYDADGDGVITRKEFTGPAELFDRLDRNRDGVLTPDDFDWSDRAAFQRDAGTARMIFGRMDRDSNGRVSREEWDEFFKKAAKGKDHLTPDDLREALFPPAPRQQGGGGGGPTPAMLLRGMFDGEVGSMHEGPSLNQKAPDFTLKTEDGKGTLTLSQFRGNKPVVLIFGSFT